MKRNHLFSLFGALLLSCIGLAEAGNTHYCTVIRDGVIQANEVVCDVGYNGTDAGSIEVSGIGSDLYDVYQQVIFLRVGGGYVMKEMAGRSSNDSRGWVQSPNDAQSPGEWCMRSGPFNMFCAKPTWINNGPNY